MPQANPLYQNFEQVVAAIAATSPSLIMVTTAAEYEGLLLSRGKTVPSEMKVTVRNLDGDDYSVRVNKLVSGHTQLLTKREREAILAKRSEFCKDGGLIKREAESIRDLASIMKLHGHSFIDISQDVECGAPDAFVESATDTSVIGVQVTRSSSGIGGIREGSNNFHKSKQYLVHQICDLGFMFFGMLYFEHRLHSILFLSPDDSALIHSLPDFDCITIYLGKEGNRTRAVKTGSLADKFADNIFMRDDFQGLMDRVQDFLVHPHNRNYTLEQLFAMVPYHHAVEAQYIKRFQSVFPDVVRMRAHGFGDASFIVGGVKVDAEFKMVQKVQKDCKKQNQRFKCEVFRKNHVIAECIQCASLVICVILVSEETTPAQRCSDPAVFEYFVGFPTRTPEGHPNIRKEHNGSKSSNLSFKFDHVTRNVQSDDTETEEFIVIRAGDSIGPEILEKLREWASRPAKHNSGHASEASGNENVDGSIDASNRSSDEFDGDEDVRILHKTPKTTQRRSRGSKSDDVGPLPSSDVGSSRPQRSQRPRYQEPEVDDNGWENSCHKCGKSSGTLMECEFGLNGGDHAVCSRSYHAKCAGLSHVPDGEFVCPKHNSGHAIEARDSEFIDGSNDSSNSSSVNSSDVDSDTDLSAFVERHKLSR